MPIRLRDTSGNATPYAPTFFERKKWQNKGEDRIPYVMDDTVATPRPSLSVNSRARRARGREMLFKLGVIECGCGLGVTEQCSEDS